MRIEAVRRIFSRCWFSEVTTEAGYDALGYYHECKDEQRDVGLGPEHDWSSHSAVCSFNAMELLFWLEGDPADRRSRLWLISDASFRSDR